MIVRIVSIVMYLFAAVTWADEGTVRVVMATAEGDIEIDLYLDQAPVTAGNFLRLVDDGDLDGATFYRVVTYDNDRGSPKIEVIQGGLGDASEAFDTIDHETTEDTGIRHTDGVISMARGAVGTASTEFFICVGDQPGLDYGQLRNSDGQGFAAFGKVVSGMDVVNSIKATPTGAGGPFPSDVPKTPVIINSATLVK